MNFIAFTTRHARTLVAAALALALAGAVAAISLPVGLFPQVDFPRIVVDLNAGSRPATQMALLVTRPVEEAIRTVPGVLDVRSETSRGSAQIAVNFGWGHDMTAATLLVNAAIAGALPGLPAGTTYDVLRMDPTVYPILSYALVPKVAGAGELVALRDFVRHQVVPLLASVPGLARVDVQGGAQAEIEVLADPRRLAAHHLTMAALGQAIGAGNVLEAVGRIQDREKLALIIADHSMHDAAAIGALVLRAGPGGVVRVRDVATVRMGTAPRWTQVVEDGKPAVLFNVYQQPNGNLVRIASDVRQRLAGLHLPPGVRLVTWYDQSQLVVQSAASVRDAVLIGLVLAALVLWLFLRSWRVTLIAALVVPASLAATVLVLSLLGMSFNIMTLGGIAASVGLLIDDAIVMLEQIARRAGGGEADAGEAAVLPAAGAFIRPLTGSSLATLIVFLPLGFLGGVTGAFSRALSLTMAAALGFSYLLTLLVLPTLARRWIDFRRWHDPAAATGGRMEMMQARLLQRLFVRPWLLLLAAIPIALVGFLAWRAVPTGFMPDIDEGGFVMDYYTPPGTALSETEREVAQADAMLRKIPEVATFSRRLGLGLGNDLGESYHGDYFIRLHANHTRSTQAVMAQVRAWMNRNLPGMRVELAQLMEDRIGDLTAVPQPIEIKLYAADPAILIPQARAVAARIAQIRGVVDVANGVRLAGDALELRIDPLEAAAQGMSVASIATAVRQAVAGSIVTRLPEASKFIGVRVRLPGGLRLQRRQLRDLPIRAPDGHIFLLHQVARSVLLTGQPQIVRDNLQPMLAVTARIEGRGLGSTVADVRAALAAPGLLRPGVRVEFGGLYHQQQIAFAGLARVFAAALVAEFLLLLFLYEQIWLAGAIMLCAAFSAVAVFIGLWLAGVTLSVTALMGMTMVLGIGTEMSVFYVSEYAAQAAVMGRRAALVMAGRTRLRPIAMTTLAGILTLLPLALAIGQGSGMQQPLAIAIIAGLLVQFPLVLLALPVLISLGPGREGEG